MHIIKKGFRKSSHKAIALFAVATVFSFLFMATPAFAGIGIGVAPNFPDTVNVGNTGIAVALDIQNVSTTGFGSINLTSIKLTPSCGNISFPCNQTDLGVFTASATGIGANACLGKTFTISVDDALTGRLLFTPSSAITLAEQTSCQIDFTVDVLKVPTIDASGIAGKQTKQLGEVTAIGGLEDGFGSGTDTTTVNPASPTIATVPSAGGPIGTILNDTATLSGGLSPTGNVTFKLFAPSDDTCSLTPVYTDVDAVAPYGTLTSLGGYTSLVAGIYRWTADYAGDANNNAVSSGCQEEQVTIVPKGHIIVDKVTNPSADPQSFAFTTTGTNYAGFSLADATTPNDQTLDAGIYTVAETELTGWDLTSATCVSSNADSETPASISLQAGETVTCTFTNTKKGHLIVQKTTLPTSDPTSFIISASGTGTITGGGAGTVTDVTDKNYEVTPGTYSVAETVPTGWDKTGDTCQNVTVTAGQTATCLLTNIKRAHIIIAKDAVPNNAQDFTFTNNFGNSNPATFNLDDDADATLSNTRNSEVLAGTYTVSEGAVAGWDSTSAICSDSSPISAIVVSAGETVTCTFTNTQQQGHIIVDKITNPSGSLQSFAFTATGIGYTNFNLTDTATPNNQILAPGTYSVAEDPISGWTSNGGICDNQQTPANITLLAGQTITCTFTNTLQPGHLIVQKTTLPTSDPTVFTINASGTGTITGGGAGTVTDAIDQSYEVTAGTYSVSETLPAGWTQTSNTCSNVAVGAGETKTCTIVNSQVLQYCSPGYWKNHPSNWITYTTGQLFSSLFEQVTIMWSAKGKPTPVTDPTLQQGLEANGGGINQLVRATINALLNTSAGLNTGLTTSGIISSFNAVYPGTDSAYQALAASFTAPENCPLGQ
jgi:plastocyanin